ncbi:conserved hypothetical protein [Ricinus communis]|uniref:Uncharacterized protein n=1 Tax=Ricinus communis TaxID=3988 RepID=B9TLR0_RICCO|nr:conserved hypothetical protein [Ricinus communis]
MQDDFLGRIAYLDGPLERLALRRGTDAIGPRRQLGKEHGARIRRRHQVRALGIHDVQLDVGAVGAALLGGEGQQQVVVGALGLHRGLLFLADAAVDVGDAVLLLRGKVCRQDGGRGQAGGQKGGQKRSRKCTLHGIPPL